MELLSGKDTPPPHIVSAGHSSFWGLTTLLSNEQGLSDAFQRPLDARLSVLISWSPSSPSSLASTPSCSLHSTPYQSCSRAAVIGRPTLTPPSELPGTCSDSGPSGHDRGDDSWLYPVLRSGFWPLATSPQELMPLLAPRAALVSGAAF